MPGAARLAAVLGNTAYRRVRAAGFGYLPDAAARLSTSMSLRRSSLACTVISALIRSSPGFARRSPTSWDSPAAPRLPTPRSRTRWRGRHAWREATPGRVHDRPTAHRTARRSPSRAAELPTRRRRPACRRRPVPRPAGRRPVRHEPRECLSLSVSVLPACRTTGGAHLKPVAATADRDVAEYTRYACATAHPKFVRPTPGGAPPPVAVPLPVVAATRVMFATRRRLGPAPGRPAPIPLQTGL